MPKMMQITYVPVTAAEEKRLAAAGFAPVVRWVRPRGRSEKAFKTREALALIEREALRESRCKP